MNFMMNLIWFILGGFVSFASWVVIGVLWCLTIVGIPIGMQCFKFAVMAAVPFGREIRISESGTSFIINVIWMLLGGVALAAEEVILGVIFCLTIVGIPFGMQHFKHAKLALFPFGAEIYRVA